MNILDIFSNKATNDHPCWLPFRGLVEQSLSCFIRTELYNKTYYFLATYRDHIYDILGK